MSTVVPADYQEFIDREVASGKFSSADEVVSEALRLFRDREQKLDALRREIMLGVEELDRGETISGEEVFRELRERFCEPRE